GVCVFRISPSAEQNETEEIKAEEEKIETEIEKEIEKDELFENGSAAAENLISEIKSEDDAINLAAKEDENETDEKIAEESKENEESK
ncbi:hypothetical protein RFZ45_20290, partial [Acinetobacter baumannii]|nr:hypothetical protein [Acinetobacter baumannii]